MERELKAIAADMADLLAELNSDLNSDLFDAMTVRQYKTENPVLRRRLADVVRRYNSLKREGKV